MLVVPTYVAESPKKGLGLFTKRNIKKGTKYWVRNENFDRLISASQIRALSKKELAYVNRYGFLEASQNWYLCEDNAKYTNHSIFANAKPEFDDKGNILWLILVEDVDAGEEIVCNYMELCLTCKNGVNFDVSECFPYAVAS